MISSIAKLMKLAGYNLVYRCLIEYLTVLLKYLDLFQSRWQGTAGIWKGVGPDWLALGYAIDCDKTNNYNYEITS